MFISDSSIELQKLALCRRPPWVAPPNATGGGKGSSIWAGRAPAADLSHSLWMRVSGHFL